MQHTEEPEDLRGFVRLQGGQQGREGAQAKRPTYCGRVVTAVDDARVVATTDISTQRHTGIDVGDALDNDVKIPIFSPSGRKATPSARRVKNPRVK